MNPWFSSLGLARFVPSRGTGWAMLLLGVLAVLAGVVALVYPGITLLTLIYIFGWFALFAGVTQIVQAFTAPTTTEGKWLIGLNGLATVVLGLLALVLPGLTLGAFILLLAIYFFVTGIMQIVTAFRGHIHGWMLFSGILGVLAGIVAAVYPGATALAIAIVFGVYAILGGITAIGAGIQILRHMPARTGHSTRFHVPAN